MKSPKLGVIFFHSNIRFLYSDVWIEKSFRSMIDQTIGDFTIYEINYGGDSYTIFDGLDIQQDKKFYDQKLENHAEAMNFIIDRAFEDGCEYVFNTNLDDYYSLDRIEKQIEFLNQGYDIVSSDFCYIKEIKGSDVVTGFLKIKKHGDIKSNLERKNNIIAHPCVAYSKKFWKRNRYNPEEIPEEDMLLWRRGIESGFKFHICDEVLLNYRLHSNQVTGDNSYLSSPGEVREEINPNKPKLSGDSSQVNSGGPLTLR